MNPTVRTLQHLRNNGWIAAPVERFIAVKQIRIDLFGFGDVVAAHAKNKRILIVQCTSLSNLSSRVAKVRSKPEAAAWLAANGEIQCWGWALREGHWQAKIVEIHGDDMQAEVVQAIPRKRRKPRYEQGVLF
jgi:hypothetical protein